MGFHANCNQLIQDLSAQFLCIGTDCSIASVGIWIVYLRALRCGGSSITGGINVDADKNISSVLMRQINTITDGHNAIIVTGTSHINSNI